MEPQTEETKQEPTTEEKKKVEVKNPITRGKHNEWVLEEILPNGVPVWRYSWENAEKHQKYPPAKLRQLRAKRGVGSRKHAAKFRSKGHAHEESATQ